MKNEPRRQRLEAMALRARKIEGLIQQLVSEIDHEIEAEKGRIPPTRPEQVRSAMLCEHANEVPSVCRCFEDCYCRRVGSCSKPGAFPLKVTPTKAPRARRR